MRRIIPWLAFLLILVGLGALIHVGTPPTPRWRVPADLPGPPEHSLLTADGRVLTITHVDGSAVALDVRDADDGRLLLNVPLSGGAGTLSPAGRWAVVRASSLVRWFDTVTGQERQADLGDTTQEVIGFSRDERYLYASTDRDVKVLDLTAAEVVAALPGGVFAVAAGGRLFVLGEKTLGIWNPDPRAAGIFRVSDDGTRALVEEAHGHALYDVTGEPRLLARVAADYERDAAFGPGVAAVLPRDVPRPIRFLDAATGRALSAFPHSGTKAFLVAFSPDGRLCVVAGDGTTRVVDVGTGRELWSLPAGEALTFSPDGGSLLFFEHGPGRSLDVRDAATGALRASVPVPLGVCEVEFHAGGSQLWAAAQLPAPSPGWLTSVLAWLSRRDETAETGVLLGLEWPSRRVLLRLAGAGGQRYHVASEGSYVITLQGDGLRRYDLPPPKPWAWSVGVPLALGGVALLASRRRQPAEEVPA